MKSPKEVYRIEMANAGQDAVALADQQLREAEKAVTEFYHVCGIEKSLAELLAKAGLPTAVCEYLAFDGVKDKLAMATWAKDREAVATMLLDGARICFRNVQSGKWPVSRTKKFTCSVMVSEEGNNLARDLFRVIVKCRVDTGVNELGVPTGTAKVNQNVSTAEQIGEAVRSATEHEDKKFEISATMINSMVQQFYDEHKVILSRMKFLGCKSMQKLKKIIAKHVFVELNVSGFHSYCAEGAGHKYIKKKKENGSTVECEELRSAWLRSNEAVKGGMRAIFNSIVMLSFNGGVANVVRRYDQLIGADHTEGKIEKAGETVPLMTVFYVEQLMDRIDSMCSEARMNNDALEVFFDKFTKKVELLRAEPGARVDTVDDAIRYLSKFGGFETLCISLDTSELQRRRKQEKEDANPSKDDRKPGKGDRGHPYGGKGAGAWGAGLARLGQQIPQVQPPPPPGGGQGGWGAGGGSTRNEKKAYDGTDNTFGGSKPRHRCLHRTGCPTDVYKRAKVTDKGCDKSFCGFTAMHGLCAYIMPNGEPCGAADHTFQEHVGWEGETIDAGKGGKKGGKPGTILIL